MVLKVMLFRKCGGYVVQELKVDEIREVVEEKPKKVGKMKSVVVVNIEE